MALSKEIMGCPLFERSFFNSSSKVLLSHRFNYKQSQFWVYPVLKKNSVQLRKIRRGPVAAISEDLVRAVQPVPEKAVKFKVRGVVTVRKKHKEDLKETVLKHLDALTDKIGRNVVLELISTEIDPSTHFFS